MQLFLSAVISKKHKSASQQQSDSTAHNSLWSVLECNLMSLQQMHIHTHSLFTHTCRHFVHQSIMDAAAIDPFFLINFPIIWLTVVWIYTVCVHSQGYGYVPLKPTWDPLS